MTHFTSLRSLGALVSILGLSSLALLGGACDRTETPDASDTEHLGSADSALTADQCNYFDVNGKIQICHYTGSGSHPYTILKTSVQGCAHGHAGHPGDYVAVDDPTCQGGGCLPAGAPSDATLACCDGLISQNGTCVDPCASAPCQNGGACAASGTGYTCTCAPGWEGTNCDVEVDECASNPCVNGDCADQVNAFECLCYPGWEGTNCDVEVDECASNPCVNGDCADQVNAFECLCYPGWEGTNCETPVCVPTTCAAQGATCGSIADGCGGTLDCGPCAPTCPCEALPAWQHFIAQDTSYDNCTNKAPNDVYLRGNASYFPGHGGAIRTGIWSQPPFELFPGFGFPSSCGAVSTADGSQFIENITEEQLVACAQIIVQIPGAGCL